MALILSCLPAIPGIATRAAPPAAPPLRPLAQASPTATSLLQGDLLKICATLPPRAQWTTAGVVSGAKVSIPAGDNGVHVRTSAGVDCALTLAEFLSLRGDGDPTTPGVFGPTYTAAAQNDYAVSDLLLWGTVAAYQNDFEMPIDVRARALADLAAAHGSASHRFANSTKAATAFADPKFDPTTLKLSDFESMVDALDYPDAPVEVLSDHFLGGLHPDAQPATKEAALEFVTVTFYERALSDIVSPAFFDMPVQHLPDTSNINNLRVAVLGRLVAQKDAIVRRVVLDWLSHAKPVHPDPGLVGDALFPAATFDETENVYFGRCSASTNNLNGVTSIARHLDGASCTYNGGNSGYWNINVMGLGSANYGFGPGQQYFIWVQSRLKGGHRNGQFLGPGDEDETTRIEYDVNGTVLIPQCSDVGACNPILNLGVRDVSTIGSNFSHDPSTSISITYQGTADAAPVDLPTNWTIVSVDRSTGPVRLSFKISRNDTHIGGCCEKDWVDQHYIAEAANVAPYPYLLQDPYAGALKYLTDASVRLAAFPKNRIVVGQIVANLGTLKTLSFADRYKDVYARFYLASLIEGAAAPALDAFDHESLTLAKSSLSNVALKTYVPTAATTFGNLQAAFNAVDFPASTKQLTHAIDHLIATLGSNEIDDLGFLDDLDTHLNGDAQTSVSTTIDAAKAAALKQDKIGVISDLLTLRNHLWALQSDWGQQLKDDAVELSLFPH